MDYDKLIEHLKRRGLGNGSALGPHSGLYDDAATAIETIRADNEKLKDSRDRWKKCAENFSAGVEQRDREDDSLQEENEKLRADLARVTAERDAAIADWRGFCAKCAWNGKQYLADGKMDDRCRTCRENGKCNWEWRGIKED